MQFCHFHQDVVDLFLVGLNPARLHRDQREKLNSKLGAVNFHASEALQNSQVE